MGKNRTTTHKGKDGNADHNKHEFMEGQQDVCGFSLEGNTDDNKGASFSVKELEFYKRYSEMVSQQNDKHIKNRQYSRVKSLEQFYNSKRYKPSEEILQYGHAGGDVPSRDDFNKMIHDYVKWQCEWSKQHGNHLHVLNYANHFDEATPHCHKREIWDYTDENGIITIGQEEAMKQAGLELPHPDKPVGRYNNRGMTYSKMCRDKWNDICEAYGYEVERVPLPGKQKSKTIPQYKAQQEREIQEKKKELEELDNSITKEFLDIVGDITGYEYDPEQITIDEVKNDLRAFRDSLLERETRADTLLEKAESLFKKAKSDADRDNIRAMREQRSKEKENEARINEVMAEWGKFIEPVEDDDEYSL